MLPEVASKSLVAKLAAPLVEPLAAASAIVKLPVVAFKVSGVLALTAKVPEALGRV
jgi:hypothetical protein